LHLRHDYVVELIVEIYFGKQYKVLVRYEKVRFILHLELAVKIIKFKHGLKMSNGLSLCQEITIAKITVTNIAEFCLGKQTTFLI